MSLHVLKDRIKPFLPVRLLKSYRTARGRLLDRHYRTLRQKQEKYDSIRSVREVFSEIYQNNLWGGKRGDFFSGYGSRFAQAERYADLVIDFIKSNNITDVVDLGCGDFEIGRHIAEACSNYVGVDVVPEVIENNRTKFGNNRVRFECLDIITDSLPNAQLCVVRQVLQHLSNDEIIRVLAQVRNYKYLIVTEHFPNKITRENKDKVHGSWSRSEDNSAVFLDKAPFNAVKLELLLEVRSVVMNQDGAAEERADLGVIRTFKVVL